MLSQLQVETTDRALWLGPILETYLDPQTSALFTARGLVRWLVRAVQGLTGGVLAAEQINVWIQVAFAWGALACMAMIGERYGGATGALAASGLMATFTCMGFLSIGYRVSYPYDFPSLFFCAAGLLLIVRDQRLLLAVLVAVAALNKETISWLVLAWAGAAWCRGVEPRRLLGWTVLLGITFLIAYAVPRYLYRSDLLGFRRTFPFHSFDLTTRTWQPRWADNLAELGFQHRGDLWQNVYWALSIHLLPLAMFRRLPSELRGAYLGVPFFAMSILLLGNVWELRLWTDILPLGVAAIVSLAAAPRQSPVALNRR